MWLIDTSNDTTVVSATLSLPKSANDIYLLFFCVSGSFLGSCWAQGHRTRNVSEIQISHLLSLNVGTLWWTYLVRILFTDECVHLHQVCILLDYIFLPLPYCRPSFSKPKCKIWGGCQQERNSRGIDGHCQCIWRACLYSAVTACFALGLPLAETIVWVKEFLTWTSQD